MKRLKESSDVPEARLGILPKHIYKLKENDKATFFSLAEKVGIPGCVNKEREER